MRRAPYLFGTLAAANLLIPSEASAFTFLQFLSLFHVVVGLLFTFSILVFVSGYGVYIARLGTWPTHRDGAIKVLEWGVTLLFVLIVLLAIERYFQVYTSIALTIVALVIIVVIGVVIVRGAASKKKKPEEE